MWRGRVGLGLCLLGAVVSPACRGAGSSSEAVAHAPRSNQGDVSFQLTPRGMVGGRFVVDLRTDTHGGDLSEIDLKSVATLRAAGKTYKPVEADSLRGHHASGSMAFALDAAPDRFEIVLDGVRSMGELTFEWP